MTPRELTKIKSDLEHIMTIEEVRVRHAMFNQWWKTHIFMYGQTLTQSPEDVQQLLVNPELSEIEKKSAMHNLATYIVGSGLVGVEQFEMEPSRGRTTNFYLHVLKP